MAISKSTKKVIKLNLTELKRLIRETIEEYNEYPGGFYQDDISRSKSDAMRSHDFLEDAIESVGGLEKWNNLTKEEQDEIIEFEKTSWQRGHRMG